MKKPFFAALSCIALVAAFPACDQHTWEDTDDGKNPGTKRLFEAHGHGDDHGHADKGHKEDAGEGHKAEAEGEKKDH